MLISVWFLMLPLKELSREEEEHTELMVESHPTYLPIATLSSMPLKKPKE